MNSAVATILIVDDEPQNRKLLDALLRSEGYETRMAADGAQALASIAGCAPDLILLDIMMPGMDGYQVAAALKGDAATSNIPIIMVSAQHDRSARMACLAAGAEEFLTKPVDRAELWLRVRNLLRLKECADLLKDHGELLERQVQARTVELQRFRTAMDATADAIFLVDRDSLRFVEVNATACNILGYTRAQLFEAGPVEIAATTRRRMERIFDSVIAGEPTHEREDTQIRRRDGSRLQIEVHRRAQRIGGGWLIIGVARDITERRQAERRMLRLAHYDALTGLPNRTLFYETLANTLVQASANGWRVAVLCIDLDHFKNVNDTRGHATGDELLRQFSDRLLRCVRIRDTVGRLGGDEFALILVMRDGQDSAVAVAGKIREALRPPFLLHGLEVIVSASIGITVHPQDATDPETLIKFADTAMYRAKQAGRDTFRFFTAQMHAEVLDRQELEDALRHAIANDEFVLHYQPKVQTNGGRIVGLEALLRWQRPGHGLVHPLAFIAVLEDTGLIVRVGRWVIDTACRQMGLWMNSAIGPMQVSVNVSGRQFMDGDLESDVHRALDAHGIPAAQLELELTESSLMINTGRTIASLTGLKQRGVEVSIDDFGTGYSSLAYLRRFPIDKLKIDIAFIREVASNPDAASITLAIIRMAHSLKLKVIAEGVETPEQLAYLKRSRCDHIQGYWFSPPLAVPELERLLLAQQRAGTGGRLARDVGTGRTVVPSAVRR